MATKVKKAAATKSPANKADAQVSGAEQAKKLTVRKDLKFRGARQAWYERLCKYDGKTLGDYVKDVTADRPSVYGARSVHQGKPEPVAGWVRFFIRNGFANLS